MGELGAGAGSSFPGALDTDATLEVASPSASKTLIRAACMNDANASIIAIETELGTDPAGTLTDVKTYLQTEHNTNGTQKISSAYAADAGSSDTYVITLAPVPTVYTAGMRVWFKANTINTGAATINVNGLGAKTIVRQGGFTLNNGDIRANYIYELVYDGTNFQIINPSRPFSDYQNATNGGSVTITTSITDIASITFNSVEVGDKIIVNGAGQNWSPVTSTHITIMRAYKTAGTSVGSFANGSAAIVRDSESLPPATNFSLELSAIWTVTTAGTLTLTLAGDATLNTTTVNAGNGRIEGLLLG